jgi:hypothetical protein
MTLESEIYSIETANINKETLDAMKNASSAMKQIHGGLTIDKVDQTMYATIQTFTTNMDRFTNFGTGRSSGNSTPSAKRLARQSHSPLATKHWMMENSRMNLKHYNRRSWMIRCCTRAKCLLQIKSGGYLVRQRQEVSWT